MQRSSTFAILGASLFVFLAVPATAQDTDATSRSQEFELKSTVFGNTRTIRVLLPPGYFGAEQREHRYPVFYFTDGIAAWDEWGVPDVVEELWEGKEIVEAIFIGIDSGGSTRESRDPSVDRANEYLPWADPSWTMPRPEPEGERFPDFLFDEVMPEVNRRYRTAIGPRNTGLAGSSYGGVIALYTAFARPGHIGYLLAESPSLHVSQGRFIEMAAEAEPLPARIYLGVGTAEGDTPEGRAQTVSSVLRLDAALLESAPRESVRLVVVEGAPHWYDAWRDRLPLALRFLVGELPAE